MPARMRCITPAQWLQHARNVVARFGDMGLFRSVPPDAVPQLDYNTHWVQMGFPHNAGTAFAVAKTEEEKNHLKTCCADVEC